MSEIDDFLDKWEKELQEVEEEKDSAFMTSVKEMPFYQQVDNVRLNKAIEIAQEYERIRLDRERGLDRKRRLDREGREDRRIHNECSCGCKTVLDVEQEISYPNEYSYLPPYINQILTVMFCPKCGRSHRIIGTVVSEKSSFRPGG